MLQTNGSIAVQAMVFNDQETVYNEANGQILPINQSMDETDECLRVSSQELAAAHTSLPF